MVDNAIILLTADLLFTGVLVTVTWWYARLTKRIAEASERSARAAVEAAKAAACSADTAERALLAESMPFVLPSFGGDEIGTGRARIRHDRPITVRECEMTVTNSGRHTALDIQLYIGDDLLHIFPVVEPGKSESHKWREDETAERLSSARHSGWLLTTKYGDPYGNRYKANVQRIVAGGVTPELRVSTYRRTKDGTWTPLLTP